MCKRGAAEARHESPYSCVASTTSCRAVAHVSGRGSGVCSLGAGALHGMRAVGIDAASQTHMRAGAHRLWACEEGTVSCLLSSYTFFARACVCHVWCEREPSPAHMRDCRDHPCLADND